MDQLIPFISDINPDNDCLNSTEGGEVAGGGGGSTAASSLDTSATPAAISPSLKPCRTAQGQAASQGTVPVVRGQSASGAQQQWEYAASNEGRIKHEDDGENGSDVVQQSQVSSSKSPSVLRNDIIGPLLLEALDGFMFMVNNTGKIQFISENVTQYLKYTQDDLEGNSIYNLVHIDDQFNFTNSLSLLTDNCSSRYQTFKCRMVIKSQDGAGGARNEVYEQMHIRAMLQQHPWDTEADRRLHPLLACIARRIGSVEKSASTALEKFTTKQDLSGIILACDTSKINSSSYSYSHLIGQNVQDFCHCNDKEQLLKHNREVLCNGSNTSGVYRFRLRDKCYFVQTKSKLFKNPTNGYPEFIMSTHSIVHECAGDAELKGSAYHSLMKAIIGQSAGGKARDMRGGSLNGRTSTSRFSSANLSPVAQQDIEDLLVETGIGLDLPFGRGQGGGGRGGGAEDADDLAAFNDIPDLSPNSPSCSVLGNMETSSFLQSDLISPAAENNRLVSALPVSTPTATVPWGNKPTANSSSGDPWGGTSTASVSPSWTGSVNRTASGGQGQRRTSQFHGLELAGRLREQLRPSSCDLGLAVMSGGGVVGGRGAGDAANFTPIQSSTNEDLYQRIYPRSISANLKSGIQLSPGMEDSPRQSTPRSSYDPSTSESSPSCPLQALKSLQVPNSAAGFNKLGLLQQIRSGAGLPEGIRKRNWSGSSGIMNRSSTTPGGRDPDKHACLLDLLTKDDNDDLGGDACALSGGSSSSICSSSIKMQPHCKMGSDRCCTVASSSQLSPVISTSTGSSSAICSPTVSTTAVGYTAHSSFSGLKSRRGYPCISSTANAASVVSPRDVPTSSLATALDAKTNPDLPDSSVKQCGGTGVSGVRGRESNKILKQLLSQEDEAGEDVDGIDADEDRKYTIGDIASAVTQSDTVVGCCQTSEGLNTNEGGSPPSSVGSSASSLLPSSTADTKIMQDLMQVRDVLEEDGAVNKVDADCKTAGVDDEKEGSNILLKQLLKDESEIPVPSNSAPAEILKTLLSGVDESPNITDDIKYAVSLLSFSRDGGGSAKEGSSDDLPCKDIKEEKYNEQESNLTAQCKSHRESNVGLLMKCKTKQPMDHLEDVKSEEAVIGSSGMMDTSPESERGVAQGGPTDRGTKRSQSGIDRPSKKNFLLAQLLSKSCETDPDLSACAASIATATPLSQMLHHSSGFQATSGGGIIASADHGAALTDERTRMTCSASLPNDQKGTGWDSRKMSQQQQRAAVLRRRQTGSIPDGSVSTCDPLIAGELDWNEKKFAAMYPEGTDACLGDIFRDTGRAGVDDLQGSTRIDADHAREDERASCSSRLSSMDDVTLLAQLEQVLNGSDLTELNSVLGLELMDAASSLSSESGGVVTCFPPAPYQPQVLPQHQQHQIQQDQQQHAPKSAINAMEEQLKKIDSTFSPMPMQFDRSPRGTRALRHLQSSASLNGGYDGSGIVPGEGRGGLGGLGGGGLGLGVCEVTDQRFLSPQSQMKGMQSALPFQTRSDIDQTALDGPYQRSGAQIGSPYPMGQLPSNQQRHQQQLLQQQAQQQHLQQQQQRQEQQLHQQVQSGPQKQMNCWSPLNVELPSVSAGDITASSSYSPISPGLQDEQMSNANISLQTTRNANFQNPLHAAGGIVPGRLPLRGDVYRTNTRQSNHLGDTNQLSDVGTQSFTSYKSFATHSGGVLGVPATQNRQRYSPAMEANPNMAYAGGRNIDMGISINESDTIGEGKPNSVGLNVADARNPNQGRINAGGNGDRAWNSQRNFNAGLAETAEQIIPSNIIQLPANGGIGPVGGNNLIGGDIGLSNARNGNLRVNSRMAGDTGNFLDYEGNISNSEHSFSINTGCGLPSAGRFDMANQSKLNRLHWPRAKGDGMGRPISGEMANFKMMAQQQLWQQHQERRKLEQLATLQQSNSIANQPSSHLNVNQMQKTMSSQPMQQQQRLQQSGFARSNTLPQQQQGASLMQQDSGSHQQQQQLQQQRRMAQNLNSHIARPLGGPQIDPLKVAAAGNLMNQELERVNEIPRHTQITQPMKNRAGADTSMIDPSYLQQQHQQQLQQQLPPMYNSQPYSNQIGRQIDDADRMVIKREADQMMGPNNLDGSYGVGNESFLRKSLAPRLRQSIMSGGHAVAVATPRWDEGSQANEDMIRGQQADRVPRLGHHHQGGGIIATGYTGADGSDPSRCAGTGASSGVGPGGVLTSTYADGGMGGYTGTGKNMLMPQAGIPTSSLEGFVGDVRLPRDQADIMSLPRKISRLQFQQQQEQLQQQQLQQQQLQQQQLQQQQLQQQQLQQQQLQQQQLQQQQLQQQQLQQQQLQQQQQQLQQQQVQQQQLQQQQLQQQQLQQLRRQQQIQQQKVQQQLQQQQLQPHQFQQQSLQHQQIPQQLGQQQLQHQQGLDQQQLQLRHQQRLIESEQANMMMTVPSQQLSHSIMTNTARTQSAASSISLPPEMNMPPGGGLAAMPPLMELDKSFDNYSMGSANNSEHFGSIAAQHHMYSDLAPGPSRTVESTKDYLLPKLRNICTTRAQANQQMSSNRLPGNSLSTDVADPGSDMIRGQEDQRLLPPSGMQPLRGGDQKMLQHHDSQSLQRLPQQQQQHQQQQFQQHYQQKMLQRQQWQQQEQNMNPQLHGDNQQQHQMQQHQQQQQQQFQQQQHQHQLQQQQQQIDSAIADSSLNDLTQSAMDDFNGLGAFPFPDDPELWNHLASSNDNELLSTMSLSLLPTDNLLEGGTEEEQRLAADQRNSLLQKLLADTI